MFYAHGLRQDLASATYNCGINECAPATLLFKERKDEGHSSGSEKNNDQLVLELLQDQLPNGRRRFLGDGCKKMSVACSQLSHKAHVEAEEAAADVPFLPCLERKSMTWLSVKPLVASTPRPLRTLSMGCAYALSILKISQRVSAGPVGKFARGCEIGRGARDRI